MSSAMPRFAKTNGRTQKLSEAPEDLFGTSKKGQGFFKTLKQKLQRTTTDLGGSQKFQETAGRTTFFVNADASATMGRTKRGDSWADHGSTTVECTESGDLDGLKRVLNLGGDIEDIDSRGNTALHIACEEGFTDIAEELINRGADCNALNEEGETPLHKAAVSGHSDIAKKLLLANANFRKLNRLGWSPLHEAVCNQRTQVVQILLACNADPNQRTSDHDTPLHKAARWEGIEIVEMLLKVGADPIAIDKEGREPKDRTNDSKIRDLLMQYQRSSARQTRFNGDQHSGQSNAAGSQHQSRQASGAASSDSVDSVQVWSVADQCEFYETQWAVFASNKDSTRSISYSDVPWPGATTSSHDIINVVLHGTKTAEEKKKRLRAELLRWHPDKFQATFGRNLKTEDRDQIFAKVKEISQAINCAAKQS